MNDTTAVDLAAICPFCGEPRVVCRCDCTCSASAKVRLLGVHVLELRDTMDRCFC